MSVRIFRDPDRGLEWRASVGLQTAGRFCPVFRRISVELWVDRELTDGIESVSEGRLCEMWWRARRRIWCDNEPWWVWWELQPDKETWTWFESASGAKRVVKAQVMFPYVSGAELADALTDAEQVG